MTARSLLLALLALASAGAHAQQTRTEARGTRARVDTTARQVGQVVVTATREAERLEDVAVPTTVISAERAETDGRLRVSDVLADVPGVTLASSSSGIGGQGVQIQGLDPAYTLILIDGEPVVGRDAGVLDMSRLTVSGLDRVEIVRGPSSSLYGSDALAGVVNLITRPPDGTSGRVRARTGTFGTNNLTLEGETAREWRGGRMGVRLTLDRFDTNGYDLDPDEFGQTGPAVGENTADLRATLGLGDRTTLRLGARATTGSLSFSRAFTDALGALAPIDQTEARLDWSLHPELRHTFRPVRGVGLASRVSVYASGYRLDTDVVNRTSGENTFDDRFDQRLTKAEGQLSALWSTTHRTLVGAGGLRDGIGGNRYGDGPDPSQSTVYAFAQHDWEPSRLLALNVSARLDDQSAVGTRVTPKVSVLLRPSERLRTRLSIGSGFRAPDPRQLYLSFTNPAGGYVVYGATRLAEALDRLDAQGRLGQVSVDRSTLGQIQPESSVAFNAEVEAEPIRGLKLTLGGFRNDVSGLIDVQSVATLLDASGREAGPVFSYVNVQRARTEGVTADVSASLANGLSLGVGYQLLRARDLDLVDAVRAGTVFSRDASGREARLGLGDYENLIGRSRHQATLRAAFARDGWSASVRSRLRSRTALRDLDGNGVATRPDEFIPATAIVDLTLGRQVRLAPSLFARSARAQLGVDNLFSTTRPDVQPGLAGRRVYVGLDVSF